MTTLKKNFKVFTVLDISTGHISKKDDDLLERSDNNPCPVVGYQTGYGIMVLVPDAIELPNVTNRLKRHKFSEQFIKILKFAQQRGCAYVNFDRDGPQYDDLKIYNW